jgi:4-amino-4-deoxy-L-arabinose transferase-like glycosyltransferase
MANQRLWQVVRLLIAAAAFGVVALVSQGIFERVPHVEDEAAYWFQAQVFAEGRLSVPTPPEPQAYVSPFVIDMNGLRFGKYPPGFPLLLSLGMRAGAPWAVNALLAAASLWLLADLGRLLYSPAAGLLAAALGLSCPALLAESGSLLSHTAALALAVLFAWAFVRTHLALEGERRAGAWRWGLLAGLALGYLALTRPYDALGVGLPFGAVTLARLLAARRRGPAGPGCWRRAGLVMGVAAILVGLLLPVYWHALTGQFTANPYLSIWGYDRPGFGPDVGVGGYTLHDAWFNLRFNLQALATGLFGWPGYLNVLFLGLACVLRPRQRWNYLLLAWCASVIGLHTTYWFYGGHDGGFPRYYFVTLPALWLLSGRGVDLAALATRRLLGRLSLRLGRVLPALALYPALVALVIYNGWVFLPPQLDVFRGRYGVTVAPLQPVQQAGLRRALVFVAGVQHWTDFAVFFAADSPTLDSTVVYAISGGAAQNQAVREAFPERACYVQRDMKLSPC